MAKLFRISPTDEVVTTPPSVVVDGGEGYASTALRNVVGFIATAAVAASSLAAQLPVASRNQPDEVPTTVQTVVEDEPSRVIVRPWSGGRVVAFTADDEIQRITVDEEAYLPPRPWQQATIPAVFESDDEQTQVVVTLTVDEETYRPPLPWSQKNAQIILDLGDEVTSLFACGHILTEGSDRVATEASDLLVTEACITVPLPGDEDFFIPPRPWATKITVAKAIEEDIVPFVQTIVEEDGQIGFIRWKQQTAKPFTADDEIQRITVDEESQQSLAVQKQWPLVRAITADDDIVPQPVTAVVEDEGWSVALPGPVVYKQLWLFDPSEVSGTLGTVPPEEDFWAVNKGQPFPPPTIVKTDDDVFVPFVPPPTIAEEDLWWVNRPWIVKKPIVAVVADDIISIPIVFQGSPDEDYPLPVIQPRPLITYHQPITADDEIVRPLHAEDEPYLPPMPWKIPPRRAFTYDDEIVKPIRVDESDWLPPLPWKIRKSPLIVQRMEWQQTDLELPAGLVTIDDPCVRQYQGDYDTPTDVEVESSIIRRPDTISLPYTTAFTIGSNVIGDASEGILQRAWKVRDGIGTVYVARANDAGNGWEPEFVLFTYTGPAITELDFAFEQAGRPVVAAERPTGPSGTGEIWIYWFKPSLGDFIFEKFDAGRTPRCALDNPLDTTDSDVMVFYIKGDNLVYRVQREDYAITNGTPIVTAANMFVEEVYRGEGRLIVVLSVRDVSTGTYSLLLLESTLYPVIIDNDKLKSDAVLLGGELHDTIIVLSLDDEEYQAIPVLQSGTLIIPIILHTLFDLGEYQASPAIQSGTLVVVLILHTLFDVDEYKADAAIQSGTLVVVVISHTLFDVDEYKADALIQSGTLV